MFTWKGRHLVLALFASKIDIIIINVIDSINSLKRL